MSAFDTRAYLAKHQDCYLSPLPLTGATAEAMDAWITTGVRKGKAGELTQIWRTNDRGHEVLAAEGYEFERACRASGSVAEWSERVLVVRSPMHATQQAAGLEKTSAPAETHLTALTPPRGRGNGRSPTKRRSSKRLPSSSPRIGWRGLLSVVWERQVEQTTHYVGRDAARRTAKSRCTRNPLPHHPDRSRGRHPRHSPPTFRAGRLLSPMRGQRGCLCRMRC